MTKPPLEIHYEDEEFQDNQFNPDPDDNSSPAIDINPMEDDAPTQPNKRQHIETKQTNKTTSAESLEILPPPPKRPLITKRCYSPIKPIEEISNPSNPTNNSPTNSNNNNNNNTNRNITNWKKTNTPNSPIRNNNINNNNNNTNNNNTNNNNNNKNPRSPSRNAHNSNINNNSWDNPPSWSDDPPKEKSTEDLFKEAEALLQLRKTEEQILQEEDDPTENEITIYLDESLTFATISEISRIILKDINAIGEDSKHLLSLIHPMSATLSKSRHYTLPIDPQAQQYVTSKLESIKTKTSWSLQPIFKNSIAHEFTYKMWLSYSHTHDNPLPEEDVQAVITSALDLNDTDIDRIAINEEGNFIIAYLLTLDAWLRALRSNPPLLILEIIEKNKTSQVSIMINKVAKLCDTSDPSIKKLFFAFDGERIKNPEKISLLTKIITKHFGSTAIIYGGGTNSEKTTGNQTQTGFIFVNPVTELVLLQKTKIAATSKITLTFRTPTKKKSNRTPRLNQHTNED
jgi:hypothetical protein